MIPSTQTNQSENPVFRFDEEAHEYWLGKRRLESVTEILSAVGLSRDYSGLSSFYADRGHAVHKATEFVDKGTLDEASVDESIRGYLEGYKKFLRESHYKPLKWEYALWDGDLGFAGTIDKVGYLGPRLGLIDIKTSKSLDPATEDQLNGYEMLWRVHHGDLPIQWKYSLQLTEDGKYLLGTKYSSSNCEDWLSIMKVFRKKQARGLCNSKKT